MDKPKMHTPNLVDEHIAKIAELFPNAVTETKKDGKTVRAIDFDVLRQELSDVEVDGPQERYQFTWPDKRKSVLLANAPIAKTLRPCREKSVDFDKTENLYIEGDNLDALKLLQETYLGKVKMIYIDPPYNTGNDFVYDDDFRQNRDDYMPGSGQYDEDGGQLVTNLESNGRFHTDWLNMIYPRLKLARDLLTDDGVIFISIDENEAENLKKICNEIFGKSLHIGTFIWKRRQMVDSRSKSGVSEDHEYMICFTKSKDQRIRGKETDMSKYSNPDNDPRGNWMSADMTGLATASQRPNLHYDLLDPNTGITYACPPTGWRYERKRMQQLIESGEVIFPKSEDGRPRRKKFAKDLQNEYAGLSTVLETVFNTQATRELKLLFDGEDYFDFPKPVDLIKIIVQQGAKNDDIVLDFFSGSATTAHAVMQLNAEDGGHRKFVMVQLPEETDEKSEARKAGYNNICEIGEERIRRAGKKIKEDNKDKEGIENLDTGFRVFKVDSTNMKDVYYKPADYKQEQMALFADNIKPDRTSEDLIFQVMLDLGILLSSKIEEKTIGGRKVFSVADGYLIACFDSNVTEEAVKEIAKLKPYYAVFRDSGMANDSVATNFEQIFKTYSPTTVRKVL